MVINQQTMRGLLIGYSAAFGQAFEETEVNYPKIAMTVSSSTRENNYAWMGQIPVMREWIGEREIQNLMQYEYIIKNKTFESTISIPVEDIADDQYGVYAPVLSEIGMSAKKHPDTLIFDLVGKGFTEKGYDGVPFFSDSHPIGRGKTTQSNMGTARLDADSYTWARRQMMTLKGDKEKTLNIVPDLLVVSPQNEAVARMILFADLIAGSSNVNKNTCELLVVPELAAYPDQWYLLCTKRYVRPFVFQEREKARLVCKNRDTDDNVFFNNEVLYGVTARCNVGYGLWQLAYGSTGEDVAEG